MVVAAVDDLLFASKLRAAARQLDVGLVFARTSDDIVAAVREHAPRLLILDLNGTRMAPLATRRAVKGDATRAQVPVVAYVSHVDTELVAAAHAAGADRVMARSQFVAQLPDLLAQAR